jgi:hypothetical protein
VFPCALDEFIVSSPAIVERTKAGLVAADPER